MLGHQHLLLELDAFPAVLLADIALDADDHAGHQDPLPPIGREVHGVGDEGGLAVHPDAMHDRRVALLHEPPRNLPRLLRDLPEAHARLDDVDVVPDLVEGHPIEHLLVGRRPARSAPERAGEVGVVPVAPDRIGIQCHQLAGSKPPPAGLVEPGIGALAGGQEPGLDEFPTLADDLLVHDREQLVLGRPRTHGVAHCGHGGLGAGHADLQALHLLGRLDGPDGEDLALAVMHLEPMRLQRHRLQMAAAVEPDLPGAAAEFAHQVGDLGGECPGGLAIAAGNRRPDQLAGSGLGHRVDHGAHMVALRIVEKNDGTRSRHEEIAGRVAQEIAEHVARAGGIALIVGIEEEKRAVAGRSHAGAKPGQATIPQPLGVDRRRLGIRQPHSICGVATKRMTHGIVEGDLVDTGRVGCDDAHGAPQHARGSMRHAAESRYAVYALPCADVATCPAAISVAADPASCDMSGGTPGRTPNSRRSRRPARPREPAGSNAPAGRWRAPCASAGNSPRG